MRMAAPDAAQACIQVEHRAVQQEVQEELPDVCDMRRHGEAGVAEPPSVVWVLVKTHGGGGMERGDCNGGPRSAGCDNKDSRQKEGDGSGTPFSIRYSVASLWFFFALLRSRCVAFFGYGATGGFCKRGGGAGEACIRCGGDRPWCTGVGRSVVTAERFLSLAGAELGSRSGCFVFV